jgi:hypothetical protein
MDEAAQAIRRIEQDYPSQSAAARNISTEYFEATTILRSLLRRAGIE